MKISLRWLHDFVDVAEFFEKPQGLADALTRAGLEVEDIQEQAKKYSHVVTGLILEKAVHPSADKLSVCKIMTGDGVVHQIVCGAQNHKKDDKVVAALPGAILPGGMKIDRAVLRGVESGGMLCSKKELGLLKEGETEPGILILPENASIGQNFATYQHLDDVVFELKVTPNRADCLSHFGLAREVSCLLDRPLKKIPPPSFATAGSTKSWISVEVRSDQCPRYAGRGVRNVRVAPSPDWLKRRLENIGMKSINNVVDVTNYVMLELGQPMHAFDAAQIQGSKIIVSTAVAGEKFATLDGTEITLKGDELMIRDGARAVAMAGVVGGKNSGVGSETKDLFLEAAYFLPSSVRRSARSHGIVTDSAYRFSRGVDPEATLQALDRAAELILQVAGGEVLGEPQDIRAALPARPVIQLDIESFSQKLGFPAELMRLENYVLRLGCEIVGKTNQSLSVKAPSFRFDLEAEVDFIEEYARLIGYSHIPEKIPQVEGVPTPHDAVYLKIRRVSELARAQGLYQAMNLIFASQEKSDSFLGSGENWKKLGLLESETSVPLVNPLSAEQGILRQTLTEGLVINALTNYRQGNESGRLFEIGKTFNKTGQGLFRENWRLAFCLWGDSRALWRPEQRPLIFELKTVLENLFAQLGLKVQFETPKNRGEIPASFHRGQFARIYSKSETPAADQSGTPIGFFGSLSPIITDREKVRVPVVVAELNLDVLMKEFDFSGKRVKAFSRFPMVERDLALVMPKSTKASEVMAVMREAAGGDLKDIETFDLYEGDKLDQGMKSVAFRLKFQSEEGTLQDAQVLEAMARVQTQLGEKLAISTR